MEELPYIVLHKVGHIGFGYYKGETCVFSMDSKERFLCFVAFSNKDIQEIANGEENWLEKFLLAKVRKGCNILDDYNLKL